MARQNHEITNTLIQLFINNSELEKASDLCQKILAADDKNSKTWNLLGIIYFIILPNTKGIANEKSL